MDRKPQRSAVGTVDKTEIARGLQAAARAGKLTREEEKLMRMRHGATVPGTFGLERADGGNPRAREKIEAIQAELFRRLFESAGDTSTKDKIVRSLKGK